MKDFNVPSTARAYRSYTELVEDPDVEVIYVATPHSHHFQNVMQCLEAGKHVLCEKAFTVNEAQARKLVTTAKAKKLFLMEAVWTRYHPISTKVRDLITGGAIGPVYRVFADLSWGADVEKKWGKEHRVMNPELAGGVLLDMGIYVSCGTLRRSQQAVCAEKTFLSRVLLGFSKRSTTPFRRQSASRQVAP